MTEAGAHVGGGPVRRAERADPYWPAQLTLLGAILLYLALPEKLTIGPTWLLPTLEGAALVALVIATPRGAMATHELRRRVAVALVGLVSVVNGVSVGLLAHYLLRGGKAGGHALILSGFVLWFTNVLLFALWYWEIDRGGPLARGGEDTPRPDLLFSQMADGARWSPPGWRPVFVDYLYLSLTNATAFSPTDTMPLTPRAKLLMGVQSLVSLLLVGLVVARAVNILA